MRIARLVRRFAPLVAVLSTVVACATPAVLTPQTGPGTQWACKPTEHYCGGTSGTCCLDGYDCGGGSFNGCPAGQCCAAPDSSMYMSAKRQVPQTAATAIH